MVRNILTALAAIIALVGVVSFIATTTANDGTNVAGYADPLGSPVGCVEIGPGVFDCDGSPTATATATVPPEPTANPNLVTPAASEESETSVIDVLPVTGAGPGVHTEQVERADGWQGYAAYSSGCNSYGRHWYRMVWWHHHWAFAYGDYYYFSGQDWKC